MRFDALAKLQIVDRQRFLQTFPEEVNIEELLAVRRLRLREKALAEALNGDHSRPLLIQTLSLTPDVAALV